MKLNFYGFNLQKIIDGCNVTDSHDLKLIDDYSNFKPSDWVFIDKDSARTKEGKDCLCKMINILYHREEYEAGLL